jgi:hypothetical protein
MIRNQSFAPPEREALKTALAALDGGANLTDAD